MKKLVILADPPWDYPRRNPALKFGGGSRGQYQTMKEEDIVRFYKSVALNTIDYKNVAFFNWVTNPRLPLFFRAIQTMNEGLTGKNRFRYSTKGFTWIKLNKVSNTPFKGPGNFSASNEEGCYLLVKGSMPPTQKLVDSVILAPKTKHSKKPTEIFNRIQKMYPPSDGHRLIELFARDKPNDYWEVFGSEINGNDIFEDIKKIRI